MSTVEPSSPPPGRPRRRRPPLRLGLLLAVLAALVAYLVLPGSDSSPAGAGCDTGAAPALATVAPAGQGALRESVARVLPQRVGRLYEEGSITSATAWSDAEPAPPPVSPTARRPAGYEMRWWAPNGDDVVSDVFVLPSAAAAERFFALATAPRCRRSAEAVETARPPLARGLAWVNPDGWAEADLYLLRGTRVYRVADVPAGERRGMAGGSELSRAFAAIDSLACLLPQAECALESSNVPV